MVIRPFNECDRTAVLELWQQCRLVVPQNDPNKDINRKLQKDPELFLVGELEGSIVATVMAGYEGHRGWINYLAVDPGCQRQGLGRELMLHAEQLLLQAGCPKINLQIRSANTDAIAFYESIGFRQDDVISFGKRLIPDE